MAVLKDKKSGNYYIRIKHYGKDYERVIGTDRRTAEIALADAKNEIRKAKQAGQRWGGFDKVQPVNKLKTFAEAAHDYIEERRGSGKKSTQGTYSSIVKHYLLPEFGKVPVKEITPSMIRKFQSALTDRDKWDIAGRGKLSAVNVNNVVRMLRSILGELYKDGELARDPSISVRRVQEDKVHIDPLSEDELEQALANVDVHYRPLFTTLAFTGARPNEIIALRWSDVDIDKEIIRINKGRVRGSEGKPKTKSSEREIPMAARVKQVLHERKVRQSVVSAQAYVFTDKNGQPINKHLDRIWARALKKAELKHRPSYQLRHTFATQCIIKGLPLPYIAKVLGHSTIDTLIRHYAHWIDSATKEHDTKLKSAFRTALDEMPNEEKVGVKVGVG